MNKSSLNIPAQDGKWGSYISKYPPDSNVVGNSAFTKGSRNLITSATGQAEKRQGGIIWNPASLLSGPALDQFEGVFSTGQRLFIVNDAGTLKASTGNGLFANLVGGTGFTNPANFEFVTYQNRVYGCNGVDAPIVIDIATSYGGTSYAATPAKVRPMGSTAPATAPTSGSPTSGGSVPAGAHTYKVTYLYYNGVEESNPSAASAIQTAAGPNFTIGLSSIPVGGYGVTGRNIYRDNNDGNYLLLTTINNNTTTTFSDTLVIGSTPTPITNINFGPPLFKYCLLYLDRIFVIDIAGKNIYWSLAGAPDVFTPQNAIAGPPDDIMTGFGFLNGLPYVFGQHTAGSILGTTDSSFYYNSLSTAVGCVDNRSIQTRLIVSVPTLMWLAALPNRGIYYTNGSIIQHMSDNIQDLTFNLAQISYLSRLNSQASQADFEGGTSTPGIDLFTNPGTIQTINPKVLYSHAGDWQAGVSSNLSPIGDTLQVPTTFSPSLGSGTLTGNAQISGANLRLAAGSDFTGESLGAAGSVNWNSDAVNTRYYSNNIAQSIIPSVTGTLGTISGLGFNMYASTAWAGNFNIVVAVYNDAGGLPGSSIGSQTFSLPGGNGADQVLSIPTATINASLTGGTRYWIVVSITQINNGGQFDSLTFTNGTWSGGGVAFSKASGGVWAPFGPPSNSTHRSIAGSYTFSKTPVADSGGWISGAYNSLSTTVTSGMSLILSTGSYPGSTSGSAQVQGSTNASSWVTTDTISNPSGTYSLTGGAYKFWRVILSLATSDNRSTPLVGTPTLTFNRTGTWTSPAIALTSDTTALNNLVQSVMIPAGTSATIQIATSALSGSGYSSFTTVGLATPNAFAKIKVTLMSSPDGTTSSSLVTAELDWTVVSTFISSIVDTGQVPSGWGIFEFQSAAVAGAVLPYFRTASSSGAIPGATFATVINGAFPTNAVYEFFQYKMVLTATADQIPQVSTVTTNWLLTSGSNVRAASLFFNKSYYLAVATQGATTNNLLIEYDYENNWRIHSGASIGTMATYFNDIYYCDALNGNIYNGFQSLTDNGTPITMDLRTKCFDLGDNLHLKTVRSLKIKGVNTGTLMHVYYSVDYGSTWNEMLNSSGTLGFQTGNDLSPFVEYFVPVFTGAVPVSGVNVMFRVVSSDAFACAILQMTPTVYVRKGKAIREAMSA